MDRRSLWENTDYACPIVGTCLTVAELWKICRKCGVRLPACTTDYTVHSFLVAEVKIPGGRMAKFVQKYLDKKYRADLRVFLRLTDTADLRRLWRQRADSGDIPGAFWALLSHPLGVGDLLHEVFGEVHMLSHQIGAVKRADLARLADLEEKMLGMKALTEKTRAATRRAVCAWKDRYRQAASALEKERFLRQEAQREKVSLRALLESSAVVSACQERDSLHEEACRMRQRLTEAILEKDRQAAIIARLQAELTRSRAAAADRESEIAALEASLFAALGDAADAHIAHAEHHMPELADANGSLPHDCPHDRLCRRKAAGMAALHGKRVLYVGGRCSLVAHYKVLAAKFGCELVHHDGGKEQSSHRLRDLLNAADAVICPVDCVSHEACAKVKQACKGCFKPLVLARSSGLSSLARSLDALGSSVVH